MGYQDNLSWRFRKLAEQALNNANDLLNSNVLLAARCVVLKTVQWAVDCKKFLPTAGAFREKIVEDAEVVAEGLHALRRSVVALGAKRARSEVYHRAANDIDGIASDTLRKRRPKLVVTSPPYPGVHVLYHRWQVLGRRETAAPYWITESNDGNGASFYTFCDRRRADHDDRYFERLQECFTAIRKVVSDECVVAQLVGFARPDEQLPKYQAAMKASGFEEFDLDRVKGGPRREDFWRAVPNRKFYVWLRDSTRQTNEILLLHRAS